jgi:hypothetical protein
MMAGLRLFSVVSAMVCAAVGPVNLLSTVKICFHSRKSPLDSARSYRG